jgi:Flp pilus assembly protein TadG
MKLMRFIRGNRGNAVVEMALVMPLLLLIGFGLTEFGRAWVTKSILTSAAREGARLAVVTAPDINAVEQRVRDVCNAARVTPTVITVTPPDPGDPQRRVTVRVEADFVVIPGKVFTDLFRDRFVGTFTGTIPLSAETVMRHEGF